MNYAIKILIYIILGGILTIWAFGWAVQSLPGIIAVLSIIIFCKNENFQIKLSDAAMKLIYKIEHNGKED